MNLVKDPPKSIAFNYSQYTRKYVYKNTLDLVLSTDAYKYTHLTIIRFIGVTYILPWWCWGWGVWWALGRSFLLRGPSEFLPLPSKLTRQISRP